MADSDRSSVSLGSTNHISKMCRVKLVPYPCMGRGSMPNGEATGKRQPQDPRRHPPEQHGKAGSAHVPPEATKLQQRPDSSALRKTLYRKP